MVTPNLVPNSEPQGPDLDALPRPAADADYVGTAFAPEGPAPAVALEAQYIVEEPVVLEEQEPIAAKPEPEVEVIAKPRRFRKIAVVVASVLALALAAGALTAVWFARRTFPRGGELALPGLHAPVRVTVDNLGVPRIYADNAEDLFKAQGYLEASNRFFQMDYRRHLAKGRLAELVGDDGVAVASDRLVRTMNWWGVAAAEWEMLDPTTKSYLQAYADGVNAYLTNRTPDTISLEYVALQRQFGQPAIEAWTPVDSIVLLKAIAWEMRSNIEDELDRALAYSALGDMPAVERLFPKYAESGNAPMLAATELANPQVAPVIQLSAMPIIPSNSRLSISGQFDPATRLAETSTLKAANITGGNLDLIPTEFGMGGSVGSSAFAISGQFTADGKPLLANDLQLHLTVPSVFEQVGLYCNQVTSECPFNMAGFSVPGFPAIMVGHNGELAWGLANLLADTADFYTEVVRGDNAMIDGRWDPVTSYEEVINVAGGAPVPITVRTVHGRPLVSDVIDLSAISNVPTIGWTSLEDFGVSLRWAALEPGHTAAGIFAVCTAKNANDMAHAATLLDSPAQAIVFATTAGDIGMQTTGKIPVRNDIAANGNEVFVPQDGTWPLDGRHSNTDWVGWVPADELPRVLNPQKGFIVAANQPVLAENAVPYLGSDFDYGFRAARITNLIQDQIQQGVPFTPNDLNTIQNDTVSTAAQELVPSLLDVDLSSEWSQAGQELLQDWDYRMDSDSAPAAYFATAWNQVMQKTFWDELPEGVWPDGSSRWLVVTRKMLNNPDDPFWDDRSTLNVTESRDEILQNAMQVARNQLTTRISGNTDYWKWGSLHKLRLENPVLGTADRPFWLRYFANPTVTPANGATLAVNSTADSVNLNDNAVVSGPVFRMVADTGNWENSTWVNVPGNSGHLASPHYSDQIGAWISGQTYPFYFRSDPAGQQKSFANFN